MSKLKRYYLVDRKIIFCKVIIKKVGLTKIHNIRNCFLQIEMLYANLKILLDNDKTQLLI